MFFSTWPDFDQLFLGEPDEEEDFDSGALYDREAGMLLDHIEIFMDLMQRGNYKEASYIAACSPKGVLRNMETLLKFKGNKIFEDWFRKNFRF